MIEQDPQPMPPAPHECCGGGSCCPCVWDRYQEALRQWRLRQGETPAPPSRPDADPDGPRYR